MRDCPVDIEVAVPQSVADGLVRDGAFGAEHCLHSRERLRHLRCDPQSVSSRPVEPTSGCAHLVAPTSCRLQASKSEQVALRHERTSEAHRSSLRRHSHRQARLHVPMSAVSNARRIGVLRSTCEVDVLDSAMAGLRASGSAGVCVLSGRAERTILARSGERERAEATNEQVDPKLNLAPESSGRT